MVKSAVNRTLARFGYRLVSAEKLESQVDQQKYQGLVDAYYDLMMLHDPALLPPS